MRIVYAPPHCMLKGLGWTALTTLASFLGLIFHAVHAFLSSKVQLDIQALVREGSFMLFSATLAASVAMDIYFENKKYDGRKGNFLHVMIWSAGLNLLFSTTCYLIILATPAEDFEYAEASKLTLGVLFTAIVTAISVKSIAFSGGGGQQ